MIKFYDTSSLLCLHDDLKFDNFIISSITLKELENIKTAHSKDGAIKAAARKVLKLLNDNIGKYSIHVYQTNMLEPIENKDLEVNNDTKILACAIDYEKNYCPDNMLFITNDMSLFAISNLFFGEDSIYKIAPIETEEYLGYKDITMTEEEM